MVFGVEARISYTLPAQPQRGPPAADELAAPPRPGADAGAAGRPRCSPVRVQLVSERRTIAGNHVRPVFVANLTVLVTAPEVGPEPVGQPLQPVRRLYADPGSEEHRQDSIVQDGRTFRVNLRSASRSTRRQRRPCRGRGRRLDTIAADGRGWPSFCRSRVAGGRRSQPRLVRRIHDQGGVSLQLRDVRGVAQRRLRHARLAAAHRRRRRDPFGWALERTVEGKRINKRRIVIERVQSAQDVRRCHIVFIVATERARIGELVAAPAGLSVLIVGDHADLAQAAPVPSSSRSGQQGRLRVNLDAARRARLSVSSKMLWPRQDRPLIGRSSVMTFFRHLSIKRKLMLITMVTSSLALLVASVGFFLVRPDRVPRAHEPRSHDAGRNLSANSMAALAFQDEQTRRRFLAALEAKDEIVAAAIYTPDGTALHATTNETPRTRRAAATPESDGSVRREPCCGCSTTSSCTSRRSARSISSPTCGSARAAARYTASVADSDVRRGARGPLLSSRSCSGHLRSRSWLSSGPCGRCRAEELRVCASSRRSDDEIGALIDGFNTMLAEIQQRDAALQSANDALQTRTQQLEQQIAERLRAQDELKTLNTTLEQRVAERSAAAEQRAEEARAVAGTRSRSRRASCSRFSTA